MLATCPVFQGPGWLWMRLAGFEPAIFALSRRRSRPLSYRRAFFGHRSHARCAHIQWSFGDSRRRDPGPGFEPGLRGSEPRVLPIRPPRRETGEITSQSTRRDSNPRLSTCEEDALGQAELLVVVYVAPWNDVIFPLVILAQEETSLLRSRNGRDRTCDFWLRKPALYPTELRPGAVLLGASQRVWLFVTVSWRLTF